MDYLAFIDRNGLYLIPALVVAIIAYPKADKSYRPILWYIYLLALNQLAESIMATVYRNNLPAYNIGGLLCFLQFLFILYFWGYFGNNKKRMIIIAFSSIVLFLAEVLFNGSLFVSTNYSKALFSFISILFSLNTINQTLFKNSNLGLFNAKNLFCFTMIIESLFWVYLAIFLNPRFDFTPNFLEAIYLVYRYCKIFLISALYFIMCLKIPKLKSNFITFNN